MGLLAQQELELYVFKTSLEEIAGAEGVKQAALKAQKEAVDKYGSYIDFRSDLSLLEDEHDMI